MTSGMTRFGFLAAAIVGLTFSAAAQQTKPADSWKDQFEVRTYKDADGKGLPYRLLKPVNYDPKKTYPLVTHLHGAGVRGTDNKAQMVDILKVFYDAQAKHPCFVAIPQCPGRAQWVNVPWGERSSTMPAQPSEPMRLAIEMIRALQKEFPVDANRLYITGLSMGGYGTWDAISRYPKMFAAAVPICGGGDEAQASKIAAVPIWAFHGDKDNVVPTERTRNMIEAIRKAGGKPQYTEYPGVNHNSWDAAYADKEMVEWMFKQTKAPGNEWTKLYETRVYKDAADKTQPYRLLRPANYDPAKKYPLVLLLHGAGERGTDNAAQLFHGAAVFAQDDTRARHPAFVMVPQCPPGDKWAALDWNEVEHTQGAKPTEPTRLTLEALAGLQKEFSIDASRIYITGLSMGGYGTWDTVARYPKLFAAAMPICGGGDAKTAVTFVGLPLWAFHGGADTTVPVANSQKMIEALKAAGGQPKYTEYPGVGHNSWTQTFNNPEVIDWLFAQKRK